MVIPINTDTTCIAMSRKRRTIELTYSTIRIVLSFKIFSICKRIGILLNNDSRVAQCSTQQKIEKGRMRYCKQSLYRTRCIQICVTSDGKYKQNKDKSEQQNKIQPILNKTTKYYPSGPNASVYFPSPKPPYKIKKFPCLQRNLYLISKTISNTSSFYSLSIVNRIPFLT